MQRTSKQILPPPIEVSLTPNLVRLKGTGNVERDLRRFTFGQCSCLVGSSKLGWHLSVSCPNRYPTWDELAHAREHLLPRDHEFALIFPPEAEYVNVHQNCFHLWEVQPSRGQPMIVPGMVIDPVGNSIPVELLVR